MQTLKHVLKRTVYQKSILFAKEAIPSLLKKIITIIIVIEAK